MNFNENIEYFAQVNSRKCYPMKKEDIKIDIPYFKIKKNQYDRYDVDIFNYENHDNKDRMFFWKIYLNSYILPNISKECNISGFYNIELHDSYTYLNNDKNYDNVMSFSKFKNDKDIVLIPDVYMMLNYRGNLLSNDNVPWKLKENKVIFCGTTTGNRNPLLNDRINTCLWSLNNKYCDFYITKIAQMNLNEVSNIHNFDKIYRDNIPIRDQLNYKYHMCIDGNTCRFDIWYLNVNNVIFKKKSREMLWYYPLYTDNNNYKDINDLNDIDRYINYYNNNPNIVENMIYNNKNLYKELIKPITTQKYLVELFENIAHNK